MPRVARRVMVSRNDGGVREREAERPSEQDDDSIPIGKAADRGRLGEGGKEAEPRVMALEELRDNENDEIRNQNPVGEQFGPMELAQSRAITLPFGHGTAS
jgi:hypothetical protein